MSATVVTTNDKYASIGTLGFHAVLVALLFLIKCPGTGGGGNGGLGASEYLSMDVAGIGNSVDGWGPTEEEVQTPNEPTPAVEESTSVTDDTPTNEAPVINTNKPAKTPNTTKPVTKPVTNTTKPVEKPVEKPNKINNVINKGSGSSSGNTKQGGAEDEAGTAVLPGGGSPGGKGGAGGGNNGGKGSGNGGVNSDHTLIGRSMMNPPTLSENFQHNAIMKVNVTVDENGNVIKAVVNIKGSTYNGEVIYVTLAEKAAMTTKFDVSKTGANRQTGTITIFFNAK